LSQKLITSFGQHFFPPKFKNPFGWDSFKVADACIANTPWEAHLMSYIFGASPEKNTFGVYALFRAYPDRFEEVREPEKTE